MINDITSYLNTATFRRHLPDWAVAFVLAFYFYFVAEHAHPFDRQFSLNDLSLSHPFTNSERVTGHECLYIGFLVPIITICAISLFDRKNQWVHKLQISLLGLIISLTTNGVFTDTLKNWIGRPRPDFLARCGAAVGTPVNILVDISVCTAPLGARALTDGMRSAPLGHSSISFSSMLYLTLWLVGQYKLLQKLKPLYKLLLAGLPLLLATYIALSRTQDYRHHFSDVILGSIIGSLFAWFSYRRYFTSVGAEDAGMVEEEELLPL